MAIILGNPPTNKSDIQNYSFEEDGNIHCYMKYEYLPARNFSLFIKSINELYELTYFLLYDERINIHEVLVLDYVKTGNSIDIIIKILEKVNPSKRTWKALAVVAAIITGIKVYDQHIIDSATAKNLELSAWVIKMEKMKTSAEIDKTKAETDKVRAETEQIEFQNVLLENQIDKDSIDKLNSEMNRKKLNKKKRSIQKYSTERPIIQTIINGIVIYNSDDNSNSRQQP